MESSERLRVGSVDAFQGKEFDVVLLSMVRTAPGKVDLENEDSLTRAYGFLRMDNRLNVAMSRQHRLSYYGWRYWNGNTSCGC